MELALGQFVLLYLLLPIVGIILGGVMFFVAKKNELLKDKKVIFYFLISCIVLAIPALFGFIDYWFMPYIYIFLMIIYLILGYFNIKILAYLIKDIKEKPYYVEFLCVFILMFVGAALFSLVFNMCNELQYGIWAASCLLPFIFSTLFAKTNRAYINIPLEVYKIWSYGKEISKIDQEYLDHNTIIVVELELFKDVSDKEPLNIKAKASENVPFGIWFKVFIDDYNKKSPQSTITHSDYNDSYGWIFYVSSSVLGRKKYIDPDLSFKDNKIKEENIIMAKRAQKDKKEEKPESHQS